MSCRFSTSISKKSLALGLALVAGLVHPTVTRAQSVDAIANSEIARRQENLTEAQQFLAKGDRAMADKDFETAYVSYLDALDKTPAGSATAAQHAAVLERFSKAGIAYAQWLITNGRYDDAERVAKTILLPQYNPSCRPAIQLLSNLEQPGYYNKTVTPSFAADREQVTKLLYEGQGFYQSGQYDLAQKRYEEVLNIDPYNIAARKGMEEATQQKTNYQSAAYNETRGRLLWLVDRSWERPVRKFQTSRSTADDELHNHSDISGTEAITAKLNRIIIPHIDLRDTTVQEAVEYLKQQSRQLDTTTTNPKEKKGVNIVLKLNDAAPVALASPSPGAPGAAAIPAAPVDAANTHITLALSNVPLIEALRYLTELAGLKFKIEPYAVSIVPLTENTDELVTKEYRVPPGFIPTQAAATPTTDTLTAPTAGKPGDAASTDINQPRIGPRTNAQDYLQSQGVPFPDGAFAQYVPAGSRLIVRNTADSIDLIDSLVDAAVGVQPTQVSIEAKFLEITQNNLSELGFDWLLGPFAIGGGTYGSGGTPGYNQPVNSANFPFSNGNGTAVGNFPVTSGNRSGIGTSVNSAITSNGIDSLLAGIPQGTNAATPGIFGLSGIFTNVQFQMVIRALSQKTGVDLMSAPKVTTKSGNKAVVKVVREFPYPTEFNPPQPPPASQGTGNSVVVVTPGSLISDGVVTPTTPTAFQKRDLGVTLEAEPVVGPDGYTIDLNLSPEVVEFDGFVNYGSPIFTYEYNVPTLSLVQEIATPNIINQPIFSVRKVTTSVSIWDGQTVSLGGLIREDIQKVQDKVPLLGDIPLAGRLFRTNVDQKIKQNLIIFVTARLLDAEGKPVRQDEDQEDVVEPLGLPQDLPPPTFQTATFGK